MSKLKYIALLLALLPAVVLAANDVTTESGASIVLPADSSSYTLNTDTRVQSFTVNNSSMDFVVEASSIINLTSGDRKDFNVTNNSQCTMTLTCGASASSIYLSCPSNTAQKTITITPSGTCTAPSTGGGSGGGGVLYIPPVTPTPVVVTSTPTPTPTPTPTSAPTPVSITAPTTPASTEIQATTLEITGVTLSAPESAVQVVSLPKYSYQPNETLKFSYKYKNEGAKTVTIKITRQLLDSKGKVVKTSTATKSLKSGATFTGSVQDVISKTLKPGLYTERVRVLNTKSKTLDENSFVINVEKLKSKVFALGEVESLSSDLAFDGTALSKVKTNVKLPTSLKLKYSYTNSTDKKHTTRMVRQLINASGKVIQTNTGKWVMDVGEKYAQSFTQSLASGLSAGSYTLKITAYDWTTKELLAENSIGFAVELK